MGQYSTEVCRSRSDVVGFARCFSFAELTVRLLAGESESLNGLAPPSIC